MTRTTRRTNLLFLSPLLSIMLLVGCSPAPEKEQQPKEARNVILFIGDGFGNTQLSLGIQYARLVEQRELNIDALMQDGNTGYSLSTAVRKYRHRLRSRCNADGNRPSGAQ